MRIVLAVLMVLATGPGRVGSAVPAEIVPGRACVAAETSPQTPQAPGRVQRPPARTGTSRIRGRVVSADSGRPLPRAVVQATSSDLADPRSATTDALGRYDFRDLPSGKYLLFATKPTYVSAPLGGRVPSDAGKTVKLGDAETASNVDIRLIRAAAISGRVVDDNGEPVPYVDVQVLQAQFVGGARRLTVIRPIVACKTDDLGQYRVFDLQGGTYYLAAIPSQASGADAGGGVGLAPSYYPGIADPGQAQAVHVEPGRDEPATDITLQSTRMARVSGSALDLTGRPAVGGSVTALLTAAGTGLDLGSTSVRPDGSFTFPSLPPGDYVFTLFTLASLGRFQRDVGRARLTVAGIDIATLTIQANFGGRFSGQIVFDGGTANRSVRGMTVSPVALDPADPAPGGATGDRQVRADGTFALTGLFGQLLFRVEGLPAGWTLKAITVYGRDVTDLSTWFEGREQMTGVQVVLTDRPTKIIGKVMSDDGTLAETAYVVVFSADPARWSMHSRYRGSAVVRDGEPFTIDGLPSGEYYAAAFAENPIGLDVSDPEALERLRRAAVRFSLEEGGMKSLTLTVR
jgi:hypothetical protein